MLQHVPIVTYSCTLLYSKQKMCLLLNWKIVHCELYVSLSALYTLWSVPIVKVILVILYYSKKKKKKRKEKNDSYLGMGKNTKVMPQKTPLSVFFLGKGRESLHLQTLFKKLSLVCFLPCPQHTKHFRFRHCVDDACQN